MYMVVFSQRPRHAKRGLCKLVILLIKLRFAEDAAFPTYLTYMRDFLKVEYCDAYERE